MTGIYLIGNPTRDTIVIGGESVASIGGTVWYAAHFLSRMGRRSAVVGNGDPEMRKILARQGVDVRHFRIARRVTFFQNTYTSSGRRQVAGAGDPIDLQNIPAAAFEAPAMLVGPVLQEVDPALLATPRRGRLLVDGQGFVRHLADGGVVVHRQLSQAGAILSRCDVLKVDSREAAVLSDGADPQTALRRFCRSGTAVSIVTLGVQGALVHDGQDLFQVSAPEVRAVDPTGAGDVFAAAFLMHYLDAQNPLEAARFAVCAASLSTRGFGISALPNRREIEALAASVHNRRVD